MFVKVGSLELGLSEAIAIVGVGVNKNMKKNFGFILKYLFDIQFLKSLKMRSTNKTFTFRSR
jgi:hypothetical protein